jgi:hypothetical protein
MAKFVFDRAANPRGDGPVVRGCRGAYLLQQLGREANGNGGGEPTAPWSLGFLVFRVGSVGVRGSSPLGSTKESAMFGRLLGAV